MSEALNRFRQALRLEHAMLEKSAPFCGLMTPSVTPADYRLFLKVMYRFYLGFENSLQQRLAAGALNAGYPYLPRLPLLVAELGDSCSSLGPESGFSLPLATVANIAGVLYVLEGSRHGSRQICAHLSQHFEKPVADFSFLNTLARQTDAESGWSQLMQHLDKSLSLPETHEQALSAARATFSGLLMIAKATP